MGSDPAKPARTARDEAVSFVEAKGSSEILALHCLIRGDEVVRLRSQLLPDVRPQARFAASERLGATPFSLAVLKDIERNPSPYRAKVDTAVRLCERLATGLSCSPSSIWATLVEPIQIDHGARSDRLTGTWHLVVPFTTGKPHRVAATRIERDPHCAFCIAHKSTPSGVVHLCPHGVGIWTHTVPVDVGAATEYAIRRRIVYKAILKGMFDTDSAVHSFREALAAARISLHTVPYVFSYFHAATYPWKREQLPIGLRLLSYPSLLLPRDKDATLDEQEIRSKEKRYFASGYVVGDFVPFSIDGVLEGVASWPGIAFHRIDSSRAITDKELLGQEVSLQATWTLLDGLRSPAPHPPLSRSRKRAWSDAQDMYATIHAVGRTQDEASCCFVNAMLKTSRISSIYEEVNRRFAKPR